MASMSHPTGNGRLRRCTDGGGGTSSGSRDSLRLNSMMSRSPSKRGVWGGGGSILNPPIPGAIGGDAKRVASRTVASHARTHGGAYINGSSALSFERTGELITASPIRPHPSMRRRPCPIKRNGNQLRACRIRSMRLRPVEECPKQPLALVLVGERGRARALRRQERLELRAARHRRRLPMLLQPLFGDVEPF